MGTIWDFSCYCQFLLKNKNVYDGLEAFVDNNVKFFSLWEPDVSLLGLSLNSCVSCECILLHFS